MWFSITARMNPAVTAAIGRIGEQAWTPIQYPQAIWEADDTMPGGGSWVSDAEVAEIDFVAFSSKRKDQRIGCRLVVRRVSNSSADRGEPQESHDGLAETIEVR